MEGDPVAKRDVSAISSSDIINQTQANRQAAARDETQFQLSKSQFSKNIKEKSHEALRAAIQCRVFVNVQRR